MRVPDVDDGGVLGSVSDSSLRKAISGLSTVQQRKDALLDIAKASWEAGWDACDASYREILKPLGIDLPPTSAKGLD